MSGQERNSDDMFQELYNNYYKAAFLTASRVIRDADLVQDIVQETFIKVYNRLDTIRNNGNKEAWIKAISRNTAIDFCRRRASRKEVSVLHIEANAASEEDGTDRFIRRCAIQDMLLALEPQLRQSLIMVYEYGMTYEQLANYQRTSVGAVKSKIHRAKKKLRSLAL
ncbi:RNA polymerase sigma factor [Paenibacillus sp. GCM10027627]|uniref:RNA polymerase sigma factor n=1 Tax=unclassified Paenibacillus TaxID=185978 RepID=UPI00363930EC